MQQKGSDEEILQSFVSSLLMDEKEPVAPQKLVVNENPISQKIVTVPHKIKPVLSERLKLAQNLLKQMPKIQDVAEASRKLEDVKVEHKTAEQKANHPVENSSVNEMVKHQPHTINGNDENPPEFSSRPKIHKPEPFAIKVRVQPQVSPPLLKRETDILTPHTPIEPQLKIKPQVIEQITTKEIQQQQAKPVTQKRISKIPDWGRGRFQTLIFKVGEIKLNRTYMFSIVRFVISIAQRIRIEEAKKLRGQINKQKGQYLERIGGLKLRLMKFRPIKKSPR